jgi:hypothetical protein
MSLFTEITAIGKTEIPYRARYKVLFDGSQPELKQVLLKFLAELDAQYLDLNDEDNQPFRWNPIDNRCELSAILQDDLELSLFVYWSVDEHQPIGVTFDLDSPTPIELSIDAVFLEPAKIAFPKIRLVYNYLNKPKITVANTSVKSDFAANRQWLQTHRLEYQGKWVALLEGTLLAEASSANELIQKIGSTQNVLLTAVY